MAEILWCGHSIHHSEFNKYGVAAQDITPIRSTGPVTTLWSHEPYLFSTHPSVSGQVMRSRLPVGSSFGSAAGIGDVFGLANTRALAALFEKVRGYGTPLTGAATSLYRARTRTLKHAMEHYQKTLLAWRNAMPKDEAARHLARQDAYLAFQELQKDFSRELRWIKSQVWTRRNRALWDFRTARGLVHRRRDTLGGLNFETEADATHLMRLDRYAKYLGRGALAIDLGTGALDVYNTYESGGNWERELFVQSAGFAGAFGAGNLAAAAGAEAFGLLMAVTPAGWVGIVILGVGALAAIGATALISAKGESTLENLVGGWYDQAVKWKNSR